MSDLPLRIKKFFVFLFPLLVLASCSNVSPELNFSTSSMIFEYENETDLPDNRLAVFLDVSSDEHRAESIKLESVASGFEWEASSPLKFENGNRKYTGYTNFVMPNSEDFPQGQYKITYIDANDETAESYLNLSYSQDIYKMNASEAASHIESIGGSSYWAAYDQYEILVFYGQKVNEMTRIDGVWRKYPSADYARTVWVSPGSRTICIMPKEYKDRPEKSEEENE